MYVSELNRDQLNQLKEEYFDQLESHDQDVLGDVCSPFEIPDDVIFEHYAGINFVEEDFGE